MKRYLVDSYLRKEDFLKFTDSTDKDLKEIIQNIKTNSSKISFNKIKYFTPNQLRFLMDTMGIQSSNQATVLSLLMCKGGVGKTTVAYNLSQRLAALGFKVLVIDADAQGNLTSAFKLLQNGYVINDSTPVLYDVVRGYCTLDDARIELEDTISILPSTGVNSLIEKELIENSNNPFKKINTLLNPLKKDFDYIVFDCAPSLNILNAALIHATDLVILPVLLDEFSIQGLKQTISEIMEINNQTKSKTQFKGLINKYSEHRKSSQKYLEDNITGIKKLFLETTIRDSEDIPNSINESTSIFKISNSTSKEDFDSLTKEIFQMSQKRMNNANAR